MLGYLDTRTETVISLVDEVATAASEAPTSVLDLCGAEKGFATGRPEGEAASALGWQMGIDQAALADVCDTVAVTGYAADPDRLSLDLDAYQTLVPMPRDSVSCSVRCRRTAGRQRTLPRRSPSPASAGRGASTSTITASAGWKLWIGFVRLSLPERGSHVGGFQTRPYRQTAASESGVWPLDLCGAGGPNYSTTAIQSTSTCMPSRFVPTVVRAGGRSRRTLCTPR